MRFFLVQDVERKRVGRDVETAITKLNRALSLHSLLKASLEKAKDALLNQLYQVGIFLKHKDSIIFKSFALTIIAGKTTCCSTPFDQLIIRLALLNKELNRKNFLIC